MSKIALAVCTALTCQAIARETKTDAIPVIPTPRQLAAARPLLPCTGSIELAAESITIRQKCR